MAGSSSMLKMIITREPKLMTVCDDNMVNEHACTSTCLMNQSKIRLRAWTERSQFGMSMARGYQKSVLSTILPMKETFDTKQMRDIIKGTLRRMEAPHRSEA